MKNTHIKTEKEMYEKLFKFAEKTGLVKNETILMEYHKEKKKILTCFIIGKIF